MIILYCSKDGQGMELPGYLMKDCLVGKMSIPTETISICHHQICFWSIQGVQCGSFLLYITRAVKRIFCLVQAQIKSPYIWICFTMVLKQSKSYITGSIKKYLPDEIEQASNKLQTKSYCFQPHKILDGR